MKKCLAFITGLVIVIAGISEESHAENYLESWYTYWGIGYANITYPGELDNLLEVVKSAPGVDNLSMSLDVLGFYWPKGEKTLIGGVLNGWGDRYEAAGEHMQISGALLSFSAIHFLSERIGQGLFLRGDFGGARLSIDSSLGGGDTSDLGFGALVGAGYGFPVAEGTRILLNFNYSIRKIEGDSYKSFQISLGGLF